MTQTRSSNHSFITLGLCLVGIMLVLFHKSLLPGVVVFANDGPLGAINAAAAAQPAGFTGVWFDLNSIGNNGGSSFTSFTAVLLWSLGPLFFAKFYPALALLILGLCAWFCFRQLKLTPLACTLGGLAAVLNSLYFSIAAWGVGPQAITAGMSFVAVGFLFAPGAPHRWLRAVLAGFAVGMGIMEGFDIGAIYSLLIAALVLFQAWVSNHRPLWQRTASGFGRLAVVAVCAGLLAAQALTGLIGVQIKGIAGAEQDTRSKAERWDWATQWSLPKREALSYFVPGLFGFRMDTPEGGNYWGAGGRDPAWDRYFAAGKQGPPPQGFIRYSGGGIYASVLVVLVAIWAAAQAFRKQHSVFDREQRRLLWFFAGAVLITLLLAFGRYAPFYQFFYALPYSSTIRNPAKFVHLVTFATVVMFALGIHGLSRRHLETAVLKTAPPVGSLKSWWANAALFDRRFVIGCLIAVAASLIAWLMYGAFHASLEQYLQTVQFDESMARAIASFSIRQVGWFVLFLALAVALLVAVVSGRIAGKRSKVGGVLLGLLLVVDLGQANLPWLVFWDYKEKYATNELIDFLREKPYEHRVAILPFRAPPQFSLLDQLYRIEWAQHHFPYFNIQSLDVIQMPRVPADLAAFEAALRFDNTPETLHRMTRRWQLTNTRYLLGAAGFLEVLNQQIDPAQRRFRIALAFDIVPKPGKLNPTQLQELTVAVKPGGQYALFEFTGALPRAKLYPRWQVSTNDSATLAQLGSPEFDPQQTVLVAEPLPPTTSAAQTNAAAADAVQFSSYAPKRIVLRPKATVPSVLLLNDKFDPNWKVFVDGKPEPLLRCNYIVRGVYLPPGEHTVEFRFQAAIWPLAVSLAAICMAVVLAGIVFVRREKLAGTNPAKPTEKK